MPVDERSSERLRAHYEIERELAGRLKSASRDERKMLYGVVYDELFARVPDHPQLTAATDPATRRATVLHQLAFLRPFIGPDTTFLEIGAGDCALALEVAHYAKTVYAVDVSETITAAASVSGEVHVVLSDGVSVDVPPGSVTLAYSNQLMEHLHPDDALTQLANIHRALAPGGRYVCVTPNRISGPHDISVYFDRVATGFHLKEYTATELAGLTRAAGFSGVAAFVHGRKRTIRVPFTLVTSVEWLLEHVPDRVRRHLVVSRPWRWILGACLVARRRPMGT